MRLANSKMFGARYESGQAQVQNVHGIDPRQQFTDDERLKSGPWLYTTSPRSAHVQHISCHAKYPRFDRGESNERSKKEATWCTNVSVVRGELFCQAQLSFVFHREKRTRLAHI